MVGNNLWYPGMEVFVNPLGIGGLEVGFPSDGGKNRSIANALGLGGYHIVTRVGNTIAPGKYDTTIEAQFHYSGDGLSRGQRLGMFKQQENEKIEQPSGKMSSPECETICSE